jgi:YVTN family beta-propeller protein
MKLLLAVTILVILLFSGVASATDKTIVCLGDSITAGAYGFGTSYPSVLQSRLPSCSVINSGLNGSATVNDHDGISSMSNRFSTEVVSYHPDYVIIMGGINDINLGLSDGTIESNLVTLCNLAKSNNITPVMCTVTPYPDHSTQVTNINAWIKSYASTNNYNYIDMYACLDDPNNHGYVNPTYLYNPSAITGVHPNAAGYTAMGNYINTSIFYTGICVYAGLPDTPSVSYFNTSSDSGVNYMTGGFSTTSGLAITPDYSRVYACNYGNNSVQVINAQTQKFISTISAGLSSPIRAKVNHYGDKLYVTNYGSNTVSIYWALNTTLITSVTVGSGPYGIDISPDDQVVYDCDYGSTTVSMINTATNTVSGTIGGFTSPNAICISPSGSTIYVTNFGAGTVSVASTVSKSITNTITVGSNPNGIAISPDGSKVYVTNYGSNSVSVITTATNTVTATINVGVHPLGVATVADGSKLYVANYGGNSVSVISTSNNTVTKTVSLNAGPKDIIVYQSPKLSSNFASNVTNLYAGNSVKFYDSSSGSPTSWYWSFGDGTYSTQQNPVKMYDSVGAHTVSLTVNNAYFNNTISKTNYINVYNATSPTPSCALTRLSDTSFTFTDTSTNIPTSWSWNFGDGATSTSQNTAHTYTTNGTYAVSLTVSNTYGSNTATVAYAVVTNGGVGGYSLPINIAGTFSNGYQKLISLPYENGMYADFSNIRFYNASTTGTPIPHWFESVTNSNTANVWIPLPTGASTVYCVWGDANKTSNVSNGYSVFPVFFDNFTGSILNTTIWTATSGTITVNNKLNFTRSSTDCVLTAKTDATGNNVILSAKFKHTGGYGAGCSVKTLLHGGIGISTSNDGYIKQLYQGSAWGNSLSSYSGNTYYIIDSVYDGSHLISWLNRGSASSWTTGTPSGHVTLNCVDAAGSVDYDWVMQRQYSATPPTATIDTNNMTTVYPPTAQFTASDFSGFAPLTIQFTDATTNTTPTSWLWQFGDGTPNSTVVNPIHTYTNIGTYLCNLTVSNVYGTTTVQHTITVSQGVSTVSSFNYFASSYIAPATITFTDTSTNHPSYWVWQWNDGTSNSNVQNPTHTFQSIGTYIVNLTSSNIYGSSTITHTIYITASAKPSADFYYTASQTVVQFNDSSTVASPTSWRWNFGDGNISNMQNPQHTYWLPQQYTTTLTVTNATGTYTATHTIDASAGPANYTQYIYKIFTPHMDIFQFILNMQTFYLMFIPAPLFWSLLIFIPFLILYIKQQSVIIPLTIFSFGGFIICMNMPPMITALSFVLFLISLTLTIVKLFVPNRGY